MNPHRTTASLALIVFALACWKFLPSPSLAADAQLGYRVANKAFRAAAQKVLPSVVSIETFGGIGGKVARKTRNSGISKPGDGPTTGTIISPDGFIITSTYNFALKPAVITVVLREGTQHVAKLVGSDETRKICLLKIDNVTGLPVPQFISTDEIEVGEWAISVGVGYGDTEPAVSTGIISAKNRMFGRAIQSDANLSPANYGGPLVDIEGRVIGICVPLSPMSQNASAGSEWYDSGIGFAIPLHGADQLIAQMKSGKTIKAGRIGIQPKPNPTAKAADGVEIAEVGPETPAGKAGIQAGDKITHVEGESILDLVHLRIVLGRYVAGDTIKIVVKRSDEAREFSVTLEAGEETGASTAQPMPVVNPAEQKPQDGEPAPK